jgi:hypothetical protein
MMRRLLVLNLALVAVLIAMSFRMHSAWVNFEATHQIAAIQPEPEAVTKVASAASGNAGAPEDWTEIPSRNPFSFDRNDIPILEPMAMVASGQPPGNRNYRPMRIGEVIDGWTITKILDKSINIKADQIEESILMNDPSAQVPRETTRTAPAGAPTSQPPPAPSALTTPSPLAAPPAPSAPPKGRRRILQQTPFGVREIEVDD